MSAPIHAFAGFGIELEYMIVDRATLAVRPIADALLCDDARDCSGERLRGPLAWSNELTLHLVELKNREPSPALEALAEGFQAEVDEIQHRLEAHGARLMPAAMHPWMDPRVETHLWPHEHAEIYRAYDRIFDCRRHGWANLQSMHLNLPFADDAEFERLHAAVRLVLPIVPALAAASPFADARASGCMDYRMAVYSDHQMRVPSSMGALIPESVRDRASYEASILAPMYAEIAALDPDGVLAHEWLNVRAAVPRFLRNAIEIRVIDIQECPRADLAIAAALIATIRELYEATRVPLADQQAFPTGALAALLADCIRDAERAAIGDTAYLELLGLPRGRAEAGELWGRLIERAGLSHGPWQAPLHTILNRGTLARRIARAVGPRVSQARLAPVYAALCDCLAQGRMFDE